MAFANGTFNVNFSGPVAFGDVKFSSNHGLIFETEGNYGVFYSSNYGESWTQSDLYNVSIFSIDIYDSHCIAGSENGIYYSNDYGVTWSSSNLTENINFVRLIGSNGIGASVSNGSYYTTDYGENWYQSSLSSGSCRKPHLDSTGLNAVVLNNGMPYVSTDGGQNWTLVSSVQTNYSNYNFLECSIYDSFILITSSNHGIIYSTSLTNTNTEGDPWLNSTIMCGEDDISTTSGYTFVSIYGTNAIATSNTNGLYFSTNGGIEWQLSNVTTGAFDFVKLQNQIGVAGSYDVTKYTIDGGATWYDIITNVYFNSATISDYRIILSGNSGNLVYYSTSPLCYNETTTVCTVMDCGVEKYVQISNLAIGTKIKTFNDIPKKIKYIDKIQYVCIDKTNDLQNMYKMIDSDLIVTGGHSILVDNYSESEQIKNLKYNFNKSISNKKLILACVSDKFTKLTHYGPFNLYHLVLENDDVKKNYGIYVNNNILSETCSEIEFNTIYKI